MIVINNMAGIQKYAYALALLVICALGCMQPSMVDATPAESCAKLAGTWCIFHTTSFGETEVITTDLCNGPTAMWKYTYYSSGTTVATGNATFTSDNAVTLYESTGSIKYEYFTWTSATAGTYCISNNATSPLTSCNGLQTYNIVKGPCQGAKSTCLSLAGQWCNQGQTGTYDTSACATSGEFTYSYTGSFGTNTGRLTDANRSVEIRAGQPNRYQYFTTNATSITYCTSTGTSQLTSCNSLAQTTITKGACGGSTTSFAASVHSAIGNASFLLLLVLLVQLVTIFA
jgi:hypothetical protein